MAMEETSLDVLYRANVLEMAVTPSVADLIRQEKIFLEEQISQEPGFIYFVYETGLKESSLISISSSPNEEDIQEDRLRRFLIQEVLAAREFDSLHNPLATYRNLRSIWVPDMGGKLPGYSYEYRFPIRVVLYSYEPKTKEIRTRLGYTSGFSC